MIMHLHLARHGGCYCVRPWPWQIAMEYAALKSGYTKSQSLQLAFASIWPWDVASIGIFVFVFLRHYNYNWMEREACNTCTHVPCEYLIIWYLIDWIATLPRCLMATNRHLLLMLLVSYNCNYFLAIVWSIINNDERLSCRKTEPC